MIGDRLIIGEHHEKAAEKIFSLIETAIAESKKYTISVGGESGSGKSEIGSALAELVGGKTGKKPAVIQQDDYFIYPPHSNAEKRRRDPEWTGMKEVKLDLLDAHIAAFKAGKGEIIKPVVHYSEDRITEEVMKFDEISVLVIEGTYTTILKNIDSKVFIDRTYKETKKARLQRAREQQDSHLEEILKKEHEIIKAHKQCADIIVSSDYGVSPVRSSL